MGYEVASTVADALVAELQRELVPFACVKVSVATAVALCVHSCVSCALQVASVGAPMCELTLLHTAHASLVMSAMTDWAAVVLRGVDGAVPTSVHAV